MKINIGYWIKKHANVFSEKFAIKSERYSLTYGELNKRVNLLANALKNAGVKKGQRVAILLYNCCEYIEIVFACGKIGAVAVPVNFRSSKKEIEFILNDCTPEFFVFDRDFLENTDCPLSIPPRKLMVSENGKDFASSYEKFLCEGSENESLDETIGGDDLIFIMYTAGTTANPKGVMLTHENIFFQTINSWALGIDPKAVGLVLLPLFHTGGMNSSLMPLLHIGATVIIRKKFDPVETLKIIEKEKVSGMVGVPIQYKLISSTVEFEKTDFSSVFALISGGAPLDDGIIKKYRGKGLNFTQGYGLTEASPGVSGMTPDECALKPQSIGRRCLYVDIEIVDENGKILPDGVEGEIIVRGPNIMKGYWNNLLETSKTIKDGWLYTGDIGKFDKDGYLYICGRKKDIIISGGENIHPSEIENAILVHKDLLECGVIGVPDEKWGEVPVAFVVRKNESIKKEDIFNFLEGRIARFKIPKNIEFVKSIPRNAAGKVLREELKKAYFKAKEA